MILKALEMQGFKSFPDKTVLEFNHGVTAVVGPNGSGKSNISDAVRWVLGEQSTKNLRGSKMEDVIFSGTDLRRAKGYAEVTLRLDNRDRALPLDRDEVCVSRRYYRSGESNYLIDGQNARLRDVNELFMDTGIGRNGYFLVGQGKISELIASRAGERRDMLEEAAGISHFRYRRGDAVKRLGQAEENLVRLRDILAEIEGRLEPLREQSEKAQEFVALAGERKNLEIGLWLHTIERTNERLREQEHRLELAEAAQAAAQGELGRLGEKIDEAVENTRKINMELEKIRTDSSRYEERAAALEAQLKVSENSVFYNHEAEERLRREIASEAQAGLSIEGQIAEAEERAQRARAEIAEVKKRADELSEREERLKSDGLAFSERTAALSDGTARLSAELAALKVSEEVSASSSEEIGARIAEIGRDLDSRRDERERLHAEKVQARALFDESGETLTALQNAMEGYTLRLQSRGRKADACRELLEQRRRELHKTQDRIRLLEDMEKNMAGYGGAVRAVLREAGRNALRGIHGPISRLISAEEGCAAAVETALGPAVQDIVTEDEADAKRAIRYLKEVGAGRATFLPIAAIRGRALEERDLEKQDGFVGIASDLVSCEERYREIVRFLLGRTAVARDLNAAVAIAKKYGYRFRVVTPDGQLVNAGGSMTGGSRAQGAGILSRGSEIRGLKRALAGAQDELKKTQEEYERLSKALAAAQSELEDAQGELFRANEEKVRREGELQLIGERLDSVLGDMEKLAAEREVLKGRLQTADENAGKARARSSELQAELKTKEQALETLAGESACLQKTAAELVRQEGRLRLNLVSLEKDVEASEDEAEKLRGRGSGHREHLNELNGEIAALEEKNLFLRRNIEDLKKSAEALKNEQADVRLRIDGLLLRRDGFEKRIGAYRLSERAKSEECEALGSEAARLQERKLAVSREYDELTAKLYDEYQLTRREAAALGIVIESYTAAGKRLSELKSKIRALGTVNLSAIEEYREVSERWEFLSAQIGDIEKSKAELSRLIGELTEKMAARFREQLGRINFNFAETFAELFDGGKAELILEDERDILESDIEIRVRPPGKTIQNIDLLSGGEKGLSAIALLFAILKVTPAPFCIFDEVETALDDANVARYARYVRRMAKNTQFILITHRRSTMEEADTLYGVTMQEEGVSKLLELRTAEMAGRLGLA